MQGFVAAAQDPKKKSSGKGGRNALFYRAFFASVQRVLSGTVTSGASPCGGAKGKGRASVATLGSGPRCAAVVSLVNGSAEAGGARSTP